MSHTDTISTSSNFRLIFDNALETYEKRTKKDLITHLLATQLQNCGSASSILDVLQQQVQELNQSRHRSERWTRWLSPTVKVLHAFSEKLGDVTSVCLSSPTCLRSALSYLFVFDTGKAFPPAKAIFIAAGVLLSVCILSKYVHVAHYNVITSQATKNVRASQDTLFEIFERLEAFFRRLEVYTETALDQRMLNTVAKIMSEVLNVLGIATNEIKQGRISKPLWYKCVAIDRATFREISKESDRK